MRIRNKKLLIFGMAAVFSMAFAATSFAATKLETPTGLYWSNTTKDDDEDEDEGHYARWDEIEDDTGFKRYELVLYRENDEGNSVKMASEIYTKKTYYNFKSKMTKTGDYYFKVRAIASGSYSNSSWSEASDYYYVSGGFDSDDGSDSDGPVASIVEKAQWVQDEVGWWYRYADGSYPYNCWFQDTDGRWYYFDETGYMKTGWITDGDKTYYCGSSGAMVTGSRSIDGQMYQFDGSGALMGDSVSGPAVEDVNLEETAMEDSLVYGEGEYVDITDIAEESQIEY